MENPEKAIEKVLGGVRDAEAPVGMERRIVDAVRDRAAVGAVRGWLRWRPIWVDTRRAGWAAGAVAMFVAVVMFYTMRRAPDLPQRHSVVVEGMPVASSKGAIEDAPRAPLNDIGRREVQERLGASRPARRARTEVTRDGDSVALSEMRAASHPAPPLPLTEQEKLLLRIAHRGDPVELAMLDPMRRAARDVEEQTEFQRFFKPRTIEQPTADQPTTEQPAVGQPATPQSTTEQQTPAQPTTDTAKPGENE
jgi:hypothetical protein